MIVKTDSILSRLKRLQRAGGGKDRRNFMGARKSGKSLRGSIGETIFAEVERLTAEGKMSKLAAFSEISRASGREVGTVAANYYRIARKRGAPLRKRRGPGRPAAAAPLRGVRGGGDLERALAALAQAIRAQQSEIEQLRRDNARMAEVRKLLGA
jgi:hypothetical protein